MPCVTLAGQAVEVDQDGFLQQPECWNEPLAQALARAEGIASLTDDHWRVIRFLRQYYLRYGVAPVIRKLCLETDFKLVRIYELFPTGPAQGACKIAGLPRPTGCV